MFTNEMKKFVEENAGVMTDSEALGALNTRFNTNVSLPAYRRTRQSMGLKKAPGRGVKRLVTATDVSLTITAKEEENTPCLLPF